MAGKYLLRSWSVNHVPNSDPFTAPENKSYPCLSGFRRLEGEDLSKEKEVITSSIVAVDGKTITTYSGSVYLLEEISPEYLSWMEANKLTYDPINPIKFKKSLDKSLN